MVAANEPAIPPSPVEGEVGEFVSTRCAIAVPDADGWRGRYCHGMGYPEHMVPALFGQMRELGGWAGRVRRFARLAVSAGSVERLRAFTTVEHAEWRYFPDEDYGPNSRDEWINSGDDHPGVYYAYLLGDDALAVHYWPAQQRWVEIGRFHWSAPAPRNDVLAGLLEG